MSALKENPNPSLALGGKGFGNELSWPGISFLNRVSLGKFLNHFGYHFPNFIKEGGIIKDIHQGCSEHFFF